MQNFKGKRNMLKNNYREQGHIYSRHGLDNTGYLAFKNVPNLIKKYAKGKKTLDYGCGSGRSTRFLKDLGLIPDGVDISQDMIREAQKIDNTISYHLIESANTSSTDKNYDIVFSSLVLFEVSSKNELTKIFNEIY